MSERGSSPSRSSARTQSCTKETPDLCNQFPLLTAPPGQAPRLANARARRAGAAALPDAACWLQDSLLVAFPPCPQMLSDLLVKKCQSIWVRACAMVWRDAGCSGGCSGTTVVGQFCRASVGLGCRVPGQGALGLRGCGAGEANPARGKVQQELNPPRHEEGPFTLPNSRSVCASYTEAAKGLSLSRSQATAEYPVAARHFGLGMGSGPGSVLAPNLPSSNLPKTHFSATSCLNGHFPKAPSLPDTKSLQSQSQISGLTWYQGGINTAGPASLGLALC